MNFYLPMASDLWQRYVLFVLGLFEYQFIQISQQIVYFFPSSVKNFNVIATCEFFIYMYYEFFTRFKYLQIRKYFIFKFVVFSTALVRHDIILPVIREITLIKRYKNIQFYIQIRNVKKVYLKKKIILQMSKMQD